MFSDFILNLVCCCVMDVIAGVLLPEGRIRKLALSVISLFLFCCLVMPLISFLKLKII